jgi:hypothetical protein
VNDRTISIEAIELATSEAIVKVLRRYGVQANGFALNAADRTAHELAGELKSMDEAGTLRLNEKQKGRQSKRLSTQ